MLFGNLAAQQIAGPKLTDNRRSLDITYSSIEDRDEHNQKMGRMYWKCSACGWKGLELTKEETVSYHNRFHSKQGTKCNCTVYDLIA